MNPDDLNLAGLCNCKLFSSPRAIPVSLMNLRPDRSRWGLKPISQTRGSLGTRFMTRCHSVSCLGIHYWHLLAFALQMSQMSSLFFFFLVVFSLFLNDFPASAQPSGEWNPSVLLVSAQTLCHHRRGASGLCPCFSHSPALVVQCLTQPRGTGKLRGQLGFILV